MKRREFLRFSVGGAVAVAARGTFARTDSPASRQGEGRIIEGFYPGNIVSLKDGSLLTDTWERSTDGRLWIKGKSPLKSGQVHGLIRLANGQIGYYTERGWSLPVALGNGTNSLQFYRSADEGATWSAPTPINVAAPAMGLSGAIFVLRSGRVMIVTYSQFLPCEELWGGSWGTYKGIRVKTESEGHFAEMEAVKVYYSDDNGSTWRANDAWILGWHDEKYTDCFVEATGVELRDGRVLLMGRSLNGRIYQATSSDQGMTWSYATPTDLMTSDSPCYLTRFPVSGDLLLVWNQISREENRKGFRRSRLSAAVSPDDGRTWTHFKTIEHGGIPAVGQIPPDPDLSPVWGDDEVGELPEDYALFHYPTVSHVGDDVYVSYLTDYFGLGNDVSGLRLVRERTGKMTRVLPRTWFYS
jgi:hypothetical protein